MPKKRDNKTKCRIDGCCKLVVTLKDQLCSGHYSRFLKNPNNLEKPLRKKRKEKIKCIINDCKSTSKHLNGYCSKHYRRWKDNGDPLVIKINEKGMGTKSKFGYIKVYDKKRKRVIPQHRIVMEKIIGRELYNDEIVHHKNGIRDDNSENNLELWTRSHPCGQRIEDVIKWAKEIIKRYEN